MQPTGHDMQLAAPTLLLSCAAAQREMHVAQHRQIDVQHRQTDLQRLRMSGQLLWFIMQHQQLRLPRSSLLID